MRTDRPIEILAGRYALEEELGRSGTGALWRAHDTILDRSVAVKILRPSLSDTPGFAERLAEEARIVAGVSFAGHAQLLDTGTERGVTFLIREFVPGESLRAYVARRGPLPPTRAAQIVADLLDALAPAHGAGVLHLDLKPENVILPPEGEVRVTDLGVGAAVRATRPATEAAEVLAPTVDPPELRDDSEADGRTDVYLAGAVLFEALTGRSPDPAGPPHVRGVPKALHTSLSGALAADPADRPQDVTAFATALRTFVERSSASRSPRERVGRDGFQGLRGWILVPMLIAIAAVAAIVAGLSLGRLEFGGPLGLRAPEEPTPALTEPPPPATTVLPILTVTAFDPFGDGEENDTGVPRATDGDVATAWRSENYFDGELHKAGVGLLFDLGEPRTVTGIRLWTPHAGYRFGVAVGDDPTALAASAEPRAEAEDGIPVTIEPTEGQYVLLWITSVVDAGDGYRAEVAEFEVVGHDA